MISHQYWLYKKNDLVFLSACLELTFLSLSLSLSLSVCLSLFVHREGANTYTSQLESQVR